MNRPVSHRARTDRHAAERAVLLVAVCVFAISASPGCSRNPATGELQLSPMSVQQEIALGAQAMPELIDEYGGESDDPTLRDYVERIGAEVATYTEEYNPDLPWEFTLLDSDVVNAFALPGGKVFITEGLMARMTNEAQLAGVLGHEIGHVTARHAANQISQQMAIAGLSYAVLRGAGAGESRLMQMIVGQTGQGFLLKFSRDDELQSDELGIRYMVRADYDPLGQLQVMEILDDVQAEYGSGPPEFLSTHPYPETRIEYIRRLIETEYAYTQDNSRFDLHEDRFRRIALPRLGDVRRRGVRPGAWRLAAGESGSAGHAAFGWCGVCAGMPLPSGVPVASR